MAARDLRDGMILRRYLPRWTFGCAIALALSAPAFAAPAEQAKPAKPAAAATTDKKGAKAKPATGTTAKPAKTALRSAAQPRAKAVKNIPLPRARPAIMVASTIPMVPAKATLSPTPILPTRFFSPITPAAAATLNPPALTDVAPQSGYAPPARTAALRRDVGQSGRIERRSGGRRDRRKEPDRKSVV